MLAIKIVDVCLDKNVGIKADRHLPLLSVAEIEDGR